MHPLVNLTNGGGDRALAVGCPLLDAQAVQKGKRTQFAYLARYAGITYSDYLTMASWEPRLIEAEVVDIVQRESGTLDAGGR
jgi:hypothetical protein